MLAKIVAFLLKNALFLPPPPLQIYLKSFLASGEIKRKQPPEEQHRIREEFDFIQKDYFRLHVFLKLIW